MAYLETHEVRHHRHLLAISHGLSSAPVQLLQDGTHPRLILVSPQDQNCTGYFPDCIPLLDGHVLLVTVQAARGQVLNHDLDLQPFSPQLLARPCFNTSPRLTVMLMQLVQKHSQ
jgi:hypothetical protein